MDRDRFLPKVDHQWSGIGDTGIEELEAHVTRVMNNPPAGSMPWSLSATSYSLALGPVDIKEHLDRWFDAESGHWVHGCSVINADFFEESRLVHNCRSANIIKAQRRPI